MFYLHPEKSADLWGIVEAGTFRYRPVPLLAGIHNRSLGCKAREKHYYK